MGHILLSWHETVLMPIHQKDETSDPPSYRPIALLSQARKVIESALDICARSQYRLSQVKTRFQKTLSTAAAIIKTLKAQRDGKSCIAVLYLQGAYDRMP